MYESRIYIYIYISIYQCIYIYIYIYMLCRLAIYKCLFIIFSYLQFLKMLRAYFLTLLFALFC